MYCLRFFVSLSIGARPSQWGLPDNVACVMSTTGNTIKHLECSLPIRFTRFQVKQCSISFLWQNRSASKAM
eukprot:UN3384